MIDGGDTKIIVDKAIEHLTKIFDDAKVCESHDITHAKAVLRHMTNAIKGADPKQLKLKLKEEDDKESDKAGEVLDVSEKGGRMYGCDVVVTRYLSTEEIKLCLLLAALLHDADDRKFFPKNLNYENLVAIMTKLDLLHLVPLTRLMVDYVSYSKWGNTEPGATAFNPWMLWPRHCDRLEAIGAVGVVRCWQYTITVGRPLYLDTTPRCKDVKEFFEAIDAREEKGKKYVGSGSDAKSDSMMGHYIDKIGRTGEIHTSNTYLNSQARQRREVSQKFYFRFSEADKVEEEWLEEYKVMMAKEAT